ncbi:hypothetical protein DY000_02007382 [Brassica cretica]|nr:hypothetical protein DY000_02007382 [Brassica cretica]
MFYGVCGEHEKNKEAFQMKLDGVYYPLNDSISWLTTCMEEMKQDIARIQNAIDVARPPSIDRRQPQSIDSRQSPSIDRHHHASIDNRLAASIDTYPPRPHTMKSRPHFHTREECIDLQGRSYTWGVGGDSELHCASTRSIDIDRQTQKQIDRHQPFNIDRQ